MSPEARRTDAGREAAEVRETVQVARPHLLRGLAVAALVAFPVALLALLVRRAFDPLIDLDQSVAGSLTGLARDHGWVLTLGTVLQTALEPWVFRVLVVVVAVLLWRRGARYAAVWAVSTLLLGSVLGVLLKTLVARARPALDDPVAKAAGFSFPSGHALNACLGVTILLVLLWQPLGRRGGRARWVAVAVGVLVVLVTGLDRIVLGVHFLSDVVAGYLVALAVVWAAWTAFGETLRQRARRETERATDDPPEKGSTR